MGMAVGAAAKDRAPSGLAGKGRTTGRLETRARLHPKTAQP